jgi:hypothetical protein
MSGSIESLSVEAAGKITTNSSTTREAEQQSQATSYQKEGEIAVVAPNAQSVHIRRLISHAVVSNEPSSPVTASNTSGSLTSGRKLNEVVAQTSTAQVASASSEADHQAEKSQRRSWGEWLSSSISSGWRVTREAVSGAAKLLGAAASLGCHALLRPQETLAAVASVVAAVAKVACTVAPIVGSAVISGVKWCAQNPGTALQAVVGFMASMVAGFVSWVWEGAKKVVSGEMSVGQALLNTFVFCCQMSGLADLCGAVKHGALALAAYGKGDRQALAAHLGQFAVHAGVVALALAMVSSLGVAAPVLMPLLAARAFLGASLKQGIVHGFKAGFRELAEYGSKAGVLAAIRGTTTVTEKQLAKTAVQYLERSAEDIAERTIERMGKAAAQKLEVELPQEMVRINKIAMEAVGAEASPEALATKINELAFDRIVALRGDGIALSMGKTLSDDVIEQGAQVLTTKRIKQLGEEIGEANTKSLLKELGLSEHVDDLTHQMLETITDPQMARKHSLNTVAPSLGLTEKQANKLVGEMDTLIEKGLSDVQIKRALEDKITERLSGVVKKNMEDSFKSTFRRGLKGELNDPDSAQWSANLHQAVKQQADELGKSVDDLSDDFVKAGWEGVENGIERATRGLVREGIEGAFQRFRNARRGIRAAPSANEAGSTKPIGVSSDDAGGSGVKAAGAQGARREGDLGTTMGVEEETARYVQEGPNGGETITTEVTRGDKVVSRRIDVREGRRGGKAPKDGSLAI